MPSIIRLANRMISSEFANARWGAMWNNGIAKGQAFDTGFPSPVLTKLMKENLIPNGRCLIPGCGRAYDIVALASSTRSVLGVDIAEAAVQEAKSFLLEQNIPADCKWEVSLTNFFDIKPEKVEEQFDFVYDYTFLCALDPSIRVDWAKQMSNIIKPNGELLTLIYPIREQITPGPPFVVTLDQYKELLLPVGFECLELDMLPDELCHPTREKASGVGRWKKIG